MPMQLLVSTSINELTVDCSKNVKVGKLLKMILNKIHVAEDEHHYFTLTYEDATKIEKYLFHDKKLRRQVNNPEKPLQLKLKPFRYPEPKTIPSLSDECLELLYVEMRTNIYNGKTSMTYNNLVTLLAIEWLVKDENAKNENITMKFKKRLPVWVFKRYRQYSLKKWKQDIITMQNELKQTHRMCFNLKHYLLFAATMTSYGETWFDWKNICFGLGIPGVRFYCSENIENPQFFSWQEIIAVKRKKMKVKMKIATQLCLIKYSIQFATKVDANNFLWLCTTLKG
ncbi:hypothetical protein T4D_10523 [Trichinella pseudospiralis]|uniref:FERM domain-containing protein n=1 Tax=Trichinella pseudospiralis TaxID=6337 RepID=A0A0V1FX99_TRIPS|nr:hypothetical protein T4D_10523 [Trichinella pseudospiralis]